MAQDRCWRCTTLLDDAARQRGTCQNCGSPVAKRASGAGGDSAADAGGDGEGIVVGAADDAAPTDATVADATLADLVREARRASEAKTIAEEPSGEDLQATLAMDPGGPGERAPHVVAATLAFGDDVSAAVRRAKAAADAKGATDPQTAATAGDAAPVASTLAAPGGAARAARRPRPGRSGATRTAAS
ncbi:MAG: hypothetical protein H6745_09000 [Deltaproteobacteria bacterium]|nr:hypothetical protein [Deltaproteobacteria bacterium]